MARNATESTVTLCLSGIDKSKILIGLTHSNANYCKKNRKLANTTRLLIMANIAKDLVRK